MIEGVQIAVVHARFVIQRILNELKCRQSEPAQEHVVRGFGRLGNHRRCPQARKRREPLTKHRNDGKITLRVYAANLAGPIVDIEIACHL